MFTNVPIPTVQEMEELAKTVGVPDGYVAIRVSKNGKVTYLTQEEYDKLWQNSETSSESSEE